MKKRFSEKRKTRAERRRGIAYSGEKKFSTKARYNDLWQANIVEICPYSGFNRGHHYIHTVINVLSKYAWAVPLKSKGGSETANVIAEIIRASGRYPKNLQMDMGNEFYNADVQKILKKHDINYSTYSTLVE